MTERLLVTGPMRSGTTMIAADVSTFVLGVKNPPEITPLSDVLELAHNWTCGYEKRRYERWIRDEALPNAIVNLTLMHLMPRESAHSWLVGKDPELIRFPDALLQLVNQFDVFLLVCIRDPLDAIASALEVFRRQRYGHSREFFIERMWNSYQGLLELLGSSEKAKSIHSVRYETYVRNPTRELNEIANWLGIPRQVDGLKIERDVDKADPYATPLLELPPTDVRVGSFAKRLSERDQEHFASVFSGVRTSLGYV